MYAHVEYDRRDDEEAEEDDLDAQSGENYVAAEVLAFFVVGVGENSAALMVLAYINLLGTEQDDAYRLLA